MTTVHTGGVSLAEIERVLPNLIDLAARYARITSYEPAEAWATVYAARALLSRIREGGERGRTLREADVLDALNIPLFGSVNSLTAERAVILAREAVRGLSGIEAPPPAQEGEG